MGFAFGEREHVGDVVEALQPRSAERCRLRVDARRLAMTSLAGERREAGAEYRVDGLLEGLSPLTVEPLELDRHVRIERECRSQTSKHSSVMS